MSSKNIAKKINLYLINDLTNIVMSFFPCTKYWNRLWNWKDTGSCDEYFTQGRYYCDECWKIVQDELDKENKHPWDIVNDIEEQYQEFAIKHNVSIEDYNDGGPFWGIRNDLWCGQTDENGLTKWRSAPLNKKNGSLILHATLPEELLLYLKKNRRKSLSKDIHRLKLY